MSEQELIDALREKDQMAIDHVYRSNYPMIRSLMHQLNVKLLPQDIYQEAFMVFLNKVMKEDLTCKISTFIYSVSRNLGLKELRDLSKYVEEKPDYANVEEDLEEYDQDLSRYEKVKTCMLQLGDKCRDIIERFYLRSHTMDEIAQEMGYTNAANAKNQKYKCMKQLKALMNG